MVGLQAEFIIHSIPNLRLKHDQAKNIVVQGLCKNHVYFTFVYITIEINLPIRLMLIVPTPIIHLILHFFSQPDSIWPAGRVHHSLYTKLNQVWLKYDQAKNSVTQELCNHVYFTFVYITIEIKLPIILNYVPSIKKKHK